jgi:phosphohistidine phosphatase
MIEVYLLRHGIAAGLGEGGVFQDADRPLTEAGLARMKAIAASMRKMDLKFNLILTSPYLRARQTAETVAAALGLQNRMKICDALAPGRAFADSGGANAEIFIQMGAYQFNRVLLVGHQPDLSELASFLLTGNHNLNIEFRKGGICGIQIASLPPRGPGLLRVLLAPRHMRYPLK